jgi:outer membrane protein assembly factor BamB
MIRSYLVVSLAFTALAAAAPVAGQSAAPVHLRLVVQRRIGAMTTPQTFGLTGANKPNGRMYRLREFIPGKTPEFVARQQDGLDLSIAEATSDGWLAFYRSPPGRDEPRNSRFITVLYSPDGERRWTLPLNPLLSRPDRLEITDVRYANGKLYFNESCQSYAREAGGRCSSLVRVDPVRGRLEWRTPPRVSNGIFILDGTYVIAGYGFTAEPDSVRVIDRETGRILAATGVDTAPEYLEVKDGRLYVMTSRSLYVYEIVRERGSGSR